MNIKDKLNTPWKRVAFLGFSISAIVLLGFTLLALFHLSFGEKKIKWVAASNSQEVDRIYYMLDNECSKKILEKINGYDPLNWDLVNFPDELTEAAKSKEPKGAALQIRENCTTRTIPERMISYPTLPNLSDIEEDILNYSIFGFFIFGFLSVWFDLTFRIYKATIGKVVRWIARG